MPCLNFPKRHFLKLPVMKLEREVGSKVYISTFIDLAHTYTHALARTHARTKFDLMFGVVHVVYVSPTGQGRSRCLIPGEIF